MVSLMQMDWPVILAVYMVMMLAGLVHGALGLGFPMVATPLVAVFLDVRTAILLTLLPTVTVNVASIISSANYKSGLVRFWPLTVFTLLGSLIGAYVLAIADPSPFRLALAALILLFLWTSHANRLPRAWMHANIGLAMVLFGLAAGFSAGTTNVMVAILIIFFLSLEVARPVMVPVLNTCFMIGKLSQIVVLSMAGLVGTALLLETIAPAAAGLVALLVGQRIRDHIPVEIYRRVLHGLLVLLAVILLAQFALEVTGFGGSETTGNGS